MSKKLSLGRTSDGMTEGERIQAFGRLTGTITIPNDDDNAYVFPDEYRVGHPWNGAYETQTIQDVFRQIAPKNVLEIGTYTGGSLRLWMDASPPGTKIISIDIEHIRPELMEEHAQERQIALTIMKRNSHQIGTLFEVKELVPEFDFIYIDGDHRYEAVQRDFTNYAPLCRPGGVVVLHDIVGEEGVTRFWHNIRAAGFLTRELVTTQAQRWYGTGVVYL